MSQFRNLVFEGGGVKGIAYGGAIKVVESKGIMADIHRFAGTSAGAITATLLALGANAADIQSILGKTNFADFMDDSWGVFRDAKRLIEDYGWHKGHAFSRWMQKQIHAFTGNPDFTFEDLKKRNHRELYVIGSNLTLQIPQVFSHESALAMPIWLAVRISMSIPLFFAAIRKDGHVFIDGGVTWNYPIDIFDDKKYLDKTVTNNSFDPASYAKPYTKYEPTHVFNKETLGFRVDTRDEIKAEMEGWRSPPKKIDDFGDYAGALVGFMMDVANKSHLHENDWHRTVAIDSLGIKTTQLTFPRRP